MSTGALQVTTITDREILITRTFHAPRNLVFEAMTEAKRCLPSSPH